MPELPEVEAARRQIRKAAAGHRIEDVEVTHDPIVFQKAAALTIKGALVDRKVVDVGRKGKYWWIELDERPWLFGHFGMSGMAVVLKDKEAIPPYTKLVLKLDNGQRIAFRDGRRLGCLWLSDGPDTDKRVSRLGFDALDDLPSAKNLHKVLQKRKAPIKAVLLDQSVFAGVGNYMADEVLYQARIAPKRLANSLSEGEVRKLRKKLQDVTRTAVDATTTDRDMPDDWLFHKRWQRVASPKIGRHTIVREEVGGRTTAWVPALQK